MFPTTRRRGLGCSGAVIGGGFSGQILTRLDEETLKKVAALTGARYFRAETVGELEAVFDEIQRLEKTEIEVKKLKRYKEAMAPFLAGGAGLLVLEFLLFGAWLRVLR